MTAGDPAARWPAGAARTPPDCRVYAVGDIHGRADLLRRLLALIAADAARRAPAARQSLIFLGDYVNRGADSRGVLEILSGAPPAGFDAVHLKGNHEVLLQRFLDDPVEQFGTWLSAGGHATLASYGVDGQQVAFGPGYARRCRDRFAAALPPRHLDFLRRLAVSHTLGDYFFVHGGVRPGITLAGQHERDLLWIKREFMDHGGRHEKMIVHGHVPLDAAELADNRISLDTRAWYSGRLTAARLEGARVDLLAT